MTQEEKILLLKDICARIPYGLKASVRGSIEENITFDILSVATNFKVFVENCFISVSHYEDIEVVRPYLRPMSSMTDEEKEYIRNKYFFEDWDSWNDLLHYHYHLINVKEIPEFMEWIYANHLDFLNLIEKGLALEAPSNMYNN